MKINTVLLSFVWIFCACNSKSNKDVYVDQNPYEEDSIDLIIDTTATFDQIEQLETIEPELIEIPIPDDSILIILPAYYHGDEIPVGYSNKNWLGVIKRDSSYYVKKLPLLIEPYKDVMIDDDDEMTGKKVVVDTTLNCTFLVSGMDINETSVPTLNILKKHIYPSDTLHLKGSTYLFAVGEKQQIGQSESYNVTDYKLIISDGNYSQVLVDEPGFDDAMISILWIGDLDQDGQFDLLIDTSDHYNRTSPTLFLSSQADKNRLVKKVAVLNSVGC